MTIELFKKIFKKVDIDEESFEFFLSSVKAMLKRVNFGDQQDYAYGLAIAHRYTLINRDSQGSGAINSESNNGYTINTSPLSEDALASTKYGLELYRLIKSVHR